MKNILLLIILVLVLIQCTTNRPEKISYIEIKHVGIEQKPVKTLFISTKVVNIDVKGNYFQINNQKPELLTGRDQFIFANSEYSVLQIDDKTFQKIIFFINQHLYFFDHTAKQDSRDIDYSIVIDGVHHDISYERETVFFSQMILFLKSENCDKKSVEALISDLGYVSQIKLSF